MFNPKIIHKKLPIKKGSFKANSYRKVNLKNKRNKKQSKKKYKSKKVIKSKTPDPIQNRSLYEEK